MTWATSRVTVALASAVAFALAAWAFTAAPGPGLDPDAMSYLGAARTFAAHGTLRIPMGPWWSDSTSQPLAHFPPGYSTVLSLPVALGMDAVQGARVVQSLAAGATAALFVITLAPVVGTLGAVLGAVALALMPAYLFVHLSVLSEPLYLTCVMLLLWSFARRPCAAWEHGLIAAAATMVRYAGLSTAGAAALWALRDTRVSWRERFKRAGIAVVPSLVAMTAWSLSRGRAPDRGQDIRKLALYGDWGPTLNEGARTVMHQLAPSLEWEPTPWLAGTVALVALVALAWSTVRLSGEVMPAPEKQDPRWDEQREVLHAAGILALAYIALVFASRALADAAIPFDFRMSVPLAPLAAAVVTIVAARAWRVISKPARVFGVLALLGWTGAAVRANYQQVKDALADGGDFASAEWTNSPTLDWVRTQGASRAVFTNLPCEIWFHLDRQVRDLPDSTDAKTMREFAAKLRATHGVMVAWNLQSPETASTDTIAARAGLVRIATLDDGSVWDVPPVSAVSPVSPVPKANALPAVAPLAVRR